MEKEAVACYLADCNCSQCMLKAAEQYYGVMISKDAYSMCGALSSGFGIGAFCNALVAGVMLFGLLADEDTAKRMRLQLLSEFYDKYHDFNCAKLIEDAPKECGCHELIEFTAGKIKEIIDAKLIK